MSTKIVIQWKHVPLAIRIQSFLIFLGTIYSALAYIRFLQIVFETWGVL